MLLDSKTETNSTAKNRKQPREGTGTDRRTVNIPTYLEATRRKTRWRLAPKEMDSIVNPEKGS